GSTAPSESARMRAARRRRGTPRRQAGISAGSGATDRHRQQGPGIAAAPAPIRRGHPRRSPILILPRRAQDVLIARHRPRRVFRCLDWADEAVAARGDIYNEPVAVAPIAQGATQRGHMDRKVGRHRTKESAPAYSSDTVSWNLV